ncbi:hypothetical protein HOLleu_14374 [Holothuria leucospilota]|uniref:Uncharacterized protein n=1 Tax=Holothuria leucospilota TaxID=206669 RepID=A0A9Q1HCF0_HOLLE|nr:hypothetical protein HOLleu_14374 [Holothuria leucospilota]
MLIFSSAYCTLLLLGLITPSQNNCDGEDEQSPSEIPQAICNKKSKSNDAQEHEELLPVLEGKVSSSKSEERVYASKDKANRFISLIISHPYVLVLVLLSSSYDYVLSSWSIFLVPLGESLGLTSETAVWLSTVSGLSGFVGRLFCIAMYFWSDINLQTGFTIPYLLIACGCLLTVFFKRFLWLAVAASLGGFGVAVLGNMTSTVIPACVCDKHFQVTVILLYTASGIMTQFGGIATGKLYNLI